MKIEIDIPEEMWKRVKNGYVPLGIGKCLKNGTPLVKAHWIEIGISGEIDGKITKAYICSQCSAISIFRVSEGRILNGDHCPNCRSKMESEDKE